MSQGIADVPQWGTHLEPPVAEGPVNSSCLVLSLALLPSSHQVWVRPTSVAGSQSSRTSCGLCGGVLMGAQCGRFFGLGAGSPGSPIPLLGTLSLSHCTSLTLYFLIFEMGLR